MACKIQPKSQQRMIQYNDRCYAQKYLTLRRQSNLVSPFLKWALELKFHCWWMITLEIIFIYRRLTYWILNWYLNALNSENLYINFAVSTTIYISLQWFTSLCRLTEYAQFAKAIKIQNRKDFQEKCHQFIVSLIVIIQNHPSKHNHKFITSNIKIGMKYWQCHYPTNTLFTVWRF